MRARISGGVSRRDRLIHEHTHDPYKTPRKLSTPTADIHNRLRENSGEPGNPSSHWGRMDTRFQHSEHPVSGPQTNSSWGTRRKDGCLHTFALILQVLLSQLALDCAAGEVFSELKRPLSKVDALNLALARNGTIRQARKDVEAAAGVAIQTRAILFPSLTAGAIYAVRQDSLIEANRDRTISPAQVDLPAIPALGVTDSTLSFGGGKSSKVNNQSWNGDIRIVQSIYEGGRMLSAARSARLIREQAWLSFQSTVSDELLSVATAYDDALRYAKQVEVREQQVKFLTEYRDDTKLRFDAGTVPEFDVIRQDVEVANGMAQLVQAQGDYRVAKQELVELLGYDLPTDITDNLPLNLTTPLVARPYPHKLPTALAVALQNRTEIAALEREERLRDEAIITARAGAKPSVQAFAGYELTSRVQTRNAGDYVNGGLAGVQMSWPIFDGFLTKGRVDEAKAKRGKAAEAKAETARVVELQVRSAWSDLRTAQSVLTAQAENIKKAVRALELAKSRYEAGTGTQIDVLNAQTALTEARGSYVDALRNYSVGRATLIRATGADLQH
jgi:outer membrane protein